MRKKKQEAPPPVEGVPAEIAVGAVVPVWGEDLLQAFRQYGIARLAWMQAEGISTEMAARMVPARSPLEGHWVGERLARVGLSEADVPRLRSAAERRLAAVA